MRTLYMSLASPYTRKVRVVLAEKGLEHADRLLTNRELSGPLLTGYAATVNPCGRIPALDDNGRVLFESNVIVDYLLTQYPDLPPNAPKPPLARSLVRPEQRWEDWETLSGIETVLDCGITTRRVIQAGGATLDPAYRAKEYDRVQSVLDWLEQRATPEGFVPGQFSIMDLNLVITLQWLDFRKVFEWRGRPNIDRLMAFHQSRPTLVATVPRLDA
ncbi:MAG: glutathione S-transferase family protein [Candidatus Lambdaproteobacteria bacterium]|nr:glutathione S-transferase family protein [Candidatus Lambdaproteobacteria bacterium]